MDVFALVVLKFRGVSSFTTLLPALFKTACFCTVQNSLFLAKPPGWHTMARNPMCRRTAGLPDTGGAVAMTEAVDGNSAMVGETSGALYAAASSSKGATAMACGTWGCF